MTTMKVWLLLLLQFAFVSTAKGCLLPSLNASYVLSLETILKNSFPENSQALLECAKGHEKEDGPSFITCLNGDWSEVELRCKKKDCGQPSPSPHMSYKIKDGTLFGDFIQSICETGYDLEGTTYRQCLVSGWSGNAKCILTTCEPPDQIEHGKINTPRDEPVFNDVVEFSCDENYILVGSSSITCGEYGEYSSPPPKCKVMECPVPTITFGRQTEGNPPYFIKSEATFECWPDYIMNGSATSVCEKSGWTPLPVCVEEATTTSTTTASTPSYERLDEQPSAALPSNYTNWIGIGIGIGIGTTVGLIAGFGMLLVYLDSKQKGSYNTGEDQRKKEELLQNV
ncbi:hypothetical protein Q8A67_014881 [Cirrhinus molitorella]|nr:hypothetical protein Q8A67_014881 [Cirrhinus molitorella]